MKKVVFVLIITLKYSYFLTGQTAELNTNIYSLKHSREDSIYLNQNKNHGDYTVELTKINAGLLKDTAMFLIRNLSTKPLKRLIYNVFYTNTVLYPISLRIDHIDAKSKYILKIPINKDSSCVLVVSDFSNQTTTLPIKLSSKSVSYNAFLKGIFIDDSSTVRNLDNHPFKINSKLEPGETVKINFKVNVGGHQNKKLKFVLATLNQDVFIINKQEIIDSVSSNGDVNLKYDISTTLNTNKGFPLVLSIIDGEKEMYKKEIYIEYNKEYRNIQSENTKNSIEVRQAIVASFKNNSICIQFDLPELTWNTKYQITLKIKDINNEKLIDRVELSDKTKYQEFISSNLSENNYYNVTAVVKKINVTPKSSYLNFNVTPSMSQSDLDVSNFKWGLRYSRIKELGYYIEINTTLNSWKHDYTFDGISKKVSGFDDYNNYYEFTKRFSIISRDIGAGLCYQLGRSLILSAGIGMYKFGFKQQIKQFSYSDNSNYVYKYVLFNEFDKTKLINKISLNYKLKNILLGFILSNYDRNDFRLSFNLGCKI